MFVAEVKFRGVRLDPRAVTRQASLLADKAAASLVNEVKLSLVSYGAIATGKTLRSVRASTGRNRPQALFGVASTGTFRRSVLAAEGMKYIVSGRRPGAKMPIRYVGQNQRGGKVFEPLPSLLEWFTALNIPREAWFPILRAISRRGIPPKPVPQRAVLAAMPNVRIHATAAARAIANTIVVRTNAG